MHLKITRENVTIRDRTHAVGDVVELPDDRARTLLMLGVAEEAAVPGGPEPARPGPQRHAAPATAVNPRPAAAEKAVSRKP